MRVNKTRNLRTKYGYILESLACVNSEHHKRYAASETTPRPYFAVAWCTETRQTLCLATLDVRRIFRS